MYFKVSQLFARPMNNYDYRTGRSVYGAIINGVYNKTARSIVKQLDSLHATYEYGGADRTGLLFYTYQQMSDSAVAFVPSSSAEFMEITKSQIVRNLLADYILPRFWDDAVAYEDDGNIRSFPSAEYINGELAFPVAQCVSDSAAVVWDRFIAWLIRSYHEKSTLLGIYEANLSKLMDKVETLNRRYDNDTPQNEDPDLDEHTSYYSRNVNQTDMTTTIDRIKEIKDKIFDIYQEWSDEFAREFVIMSV